MKNYYVPRVYLTPDSPDAFKDMEKRKAEEYSYGKPVECPKCHGYGGWNLTIDAYGKGKHFKAGCGQCNGWGYVTKGSKDEACVHEYREISQADAREAGITHFGMCWHVYKCDKCGAFKATDSSD